MGARHIDPEIIRGFIKVRDDLLFWLSEQDGPRHEEVVRLWEAFALLVEGVEDAKRVAGFNEDEDG